MPLLKKKPIFVATKSKIILALLFAGFALLMAWGVSKYVFGEVLGNLQQISVPNDKLRLVNKIAHQIASLDHLQRETDAKSNYLFTTQQLRKSLDSLSGLYQQDSNQYGRISKIKSLLNDRDEQYLAYLKVKSTLLSTQSFSSEIIKLNELLAQSTRNADSTIYTTQTSTAETTLSADDEKSKGFLSRLFGKKKAEVYKIINEEYKIKRDTINPAVQDSIMQDVSNTLKAIENEQRKKSNLFLMKEADLARSSSVLTKQMLTVLKEVENDAFLSLEINQIQAKTTVENGVNEIKVIIIVFFIITLLLGILILVDISKNNKYRIALEKAKDEAEYHGKAKQRFLANMSHEIRTPLQSILGYAELVEAQKNPDKKYISAIHQSSNHLLQIVNEILDYNRIISGEFVFENHDFNLKKTLNTIVQSMAPMAEKKQLTLITDFKFDDNLWVNGDDFRLKQILYNLLGNAIKFTAEGNVKIIATCKLKDDDIHCYFTVTDTGIGFAKEERVKIFNAFEQASGSLQQAINQEGAGLGLTIVKALVEALNGRITVHSTLGEGSSFSVYLKFKKTYKKIKTATITAHKSFIKASKVWVIDDDNLILQLCEIIFNEQQIPYQSFSKAHDILNTSIDEKVSHVLIDMRLEGASGLDVYQQLKNKLSPSVQYFAMTAQVLPDERDEVLAKGFEGVLMKPFKKDNLLQILGIATESYSFNDSALLKMTMGDEELMKKILTNFIKDCEEDEQLLNAYLKNNDVTNCRLIIHRLAGRTAQIGAKDLGAKFRELEFEVAAATSITAPLIQKVMDSIAALNQILLLVSNRVVTVSY